MRTTRFDGLNPPARTPNVLNLDNCRARALLTSYVGVASHVVAMALRATPWCHQRGRGIPLSPESPGTRSPPADFLAQHRLHRQREICAQGLPAHVRWRQSELQADPSAGRRRHRHLFNLRLLSLQCSRMAHHRGGMSFVLTPHALSSRPQRLRANAARIHR